MHATAIGASIFLIGLFILSAGSLGKAVAESDGDSFSLILNENEISGLDRRLNADMDDSRAVFVEILKRLPPTVRVYPTENYYYFRFTNGGLGYAGNILLAHSVIGAGKVMFNYFVATTSWHYDDKDHFVILGPDENVNVIRHAPLEYSIVADGISVRFLLNDLSNVRPPPGLLGREEIYMGPVFDESGMEFFLIYNSARQRFAFVLNEDSSKRDQFVPLASKSSFDQGLRTGFIYWKDSVKNRRVLVAVFENNVGLNNSLDGPFDQLPDNFIKGETLREAILDARPDLKGSIDRFGNYAVGEKRYLVSPYLHYSTPYDLVPLELCMKKLTSTSVEDCIVSLMPDP